MRNSHKIEKIWFDILNVQNLLFLAVSSNFLYFQSFISKNCLKVNHFCKNVNFRFSLKMCSKNVVPLMKWTKTKYCLEKYFYMKKVKVSSDPTYFCKYESWPNKLGQFWVMTQPNPLRPVYFLIYVHPLKLCEW